MPKQIIGRVIKAPEGWKWLNGKLSPSGRFDAESFDALYAWAKEKKYGLVPDLQNPFYQDGWAISCYFNVYHDSWSETEKWLGDGKWQPRKNRLTRISLGAYFTTYGGYEYYNRCTWCDRTGLASWFVGAGQQRYCANCCTKCKTCEQRVAVNAQYASHKDQCEVCVPRVRCHFCSIWHAASDCELTQAGGHVCVDCQSAYRCAECQEYPDRVYPQDDGTKLCGSCNGNRIDKERIPHEKFLVSELPKGGSLKIEPLGNRPVRCISIETEVDGDKDALANTLYNDGLVREAFVESYGTQCPDGSSWPAFLKHDGSVTGGELINYLIQFDKDEHAESVKTVLAKLRSLEKIGKVHYNPNCGGHIHIDAHNFSSDNIWRLVTGYNYLEDVIFRLAGAGHSYGHRTLVPGHDAANNGRGYSHPTAKGPWGIKSNAYRACMGQDRMTGLNFQPYHRSVDYCTCGAGADNLRACKCVLPKCTIEWRVWNSQGNPRILHGWIAFMQSLHAWADSPKEMTPQEENEYPPLAWTKLPWSKTTEGHRKVALERVRWIFENLVFSDVERDSLLFAFGKTDIEWPAGFLSELKKIPTPKNRTVKVPRNCSIRTTPLKAERPKRKVFGDAKRDPEYLALRRNRQADRILGRADGHVNADVAAQYAAAIGNQRALRWR